MQGTLHIREKGGQYTPLNGTTEPPKLKPGILAERPRKGERALAQEIRAEHEECL